MAGESTMRIVCFLGVFLLVAVWELLSPCRPLSDSKKNRWLTNLTLVTVNTLLARAILPVLPVGLAVMAEHQGWGLLNWLTLPGWLKIAVALILLDLIIYCQHLLFHYQPLLWRLHRMHHTDLDIDVTTGNRFHPLEIIISLLLKLAAVALLGAPAIAVLSFEIILNATAQFSHGNILMPSRIDRWLRLILVTPDMHRVHHSIIVRETNSNFGFNISLWDRLLGTYRCQPAEGHSGMTIGLKEFRDPASLTLPLLLIQPFTAIKPAK